jgi:fructokinase
MNSWKLDTAGLQTDDEHPTGTVQIHLHEGEPHFDIVSDQAYDFLKVDALPDLDQPAFLYHGSLAVRGRTSREALDALLKDHAPRVFLDVNLRKPWWSVDEVIGMMDRCTWLKLNADELDELVPGEGNLTARVQDLRHRFELEQVVVTRGGEGALAVTAGAEKVKVRPQPAVRLVDTVGAGDAFASVLMLGLLRNWTLPETLGRAQDFASSIVGVRGATVADPGFYQNHLKNWNAHS